MTWRQGAFVVVQCDDRDRWLAERRRAVGASEAGAVWGVSSYLSRLELHAAKRGVDVPRPDDDADWLADGQDLEEAIARIYARRERAQLFDPGRTTLLRSSTWPWMQATLDRVVIAGERVDRDGCGVLEAKNRALRPGVLEDWRAGAPLEIVLQVQHQLAVTGWRWGAIAALVGGRIQIVDVERDDELIALHVDACQRVIEDAASGSEPPADGSASSRRAIGALYPRDDGSVVDLDGGAALTARRLRRYREVAARIKARDDELSNQLRQAMGTHSAGRLPDGSIWTLKRNAAGVRPLVWRKK